MDMSRTPSPRSRLERSTIWLLLAVALLWTGLAASLQAQNQAAGRPAEGLYIIRLRRPSLAEYLISSRTGGTNLRVQARTRSAEAYDAQLRLEQQSFIDRISADPRLSVRAGCTFLVNVVFVQGEQATVEGLRSDPEVSGVYRSQPRYPMLDNAVGMIGAPDLWGSLGGISQAGRGVKIAVIDSGIYQDHPMFRGDGLTPPPGFPKFDPSRPGDVQYTNNKVIVARTFWRDFPDPNQTEDRTPADQQGHGSRVASIAAGGVADAPLGTIEGVAPMAFLGNYKIFGSGVNTTTTTNAVIAAIDQAAQDEMDVINLSLGGPPLDPGTDPEQEAIANAVELGIVVVAAAGNLGPEAETVTSPGTSPDAITVGAVTNGRTFGPAIEIGPAGSVPQDLRTIAYTPGLDVSVPNAVGPYSLASVAEWDSSEEICESVSIPTGALSGKIALVKRGNCTFQVKADQVFDAGAAALVVYDNVRGESTVMLFDSVRGPSVMIQRDDGEALRDLIRSGPAAPLTALIRPSTEEFALPAEGDVVATFSGRGPNLDGSLKPDLLAVGTEIYAASNRPNTFSQGSGGTSFSTPMVSGAAALLHQLHPGWSPQAIKSALVSTAAKTPHVEDQPAHLTQMGNGRLDLSRLASLDSIVEPVSISFGFLSGTEGTPSKTLTIRNLGTSQRQYSLRFEPWLDAADTGVSLSQTHLVLPGRDSAQVEVSLDVSALPEGETLEGFVVVSGGSGEPDLTIPVWGALVTEDPSVTLEVSQQDPTAFHSLAAAIQAAGQGNLIEITDSGTYNAPGTIRINAQGVPLNGLRIRGRSGENPVIEPSPLAQGDPVLSISGVQRFALEGLHIRGGQYGIAFYQSSGLVKDCLVDVDPGSALGFGIRMNQSRIQIYGTHITGTDGSGVSVLDSEALLQGSRIGDEDSGNPIHGSAVTVATSGSTALFDNTLQGGPSNHPGLDVNASTVLIKGNRIFDFSGAAAPGIRVTSGLSQLEAVDNLIENNGGEGLLLLNGATADLSGNRWLHNGSAGLRLQSGTLLTGRAETILQNSQGILAFGAGLNLTDSLVAFSQDQGIGSTDSLLQLINDTVFGNGSAGISVSGGSATLVANSISYGNQAGQDLVGVSPAVSIHNLVGNQGPEAGAAASDAGPLQSPESGNFAPAAGSAAIDGGRDDFVEPAATDLDGHRRVVDGDGRNGAQVDIGALEFASDTIPPLI
ncbi:MAG: S8 family serine peptidase, partial [Acidobacteriota bacterium]